MAHIVYVTDGMTSTVNSSLELTRRLARAGHRVTYVSQADLRAVMTANAQEFRQVTSDRGFAAQLDALPPPWKRGRRWGPGTLLRWYIARRRLRAQSAELGSFEALLRELQPELVILDIELHAAVITAMSMGLPVVLVMVFFSVFRHADLPPMHSTLLPGTRLAERARIRWAWVATNAARLRGEWRSRLSRSGLAHYLEPVRFDARSIDDLQAVARARGIDLATEADRTHWLRPLVYTRRPVLSFNIRELEFPHTPPPNLHYVGPMVARERHEVVTDEDSLRKWEAWKARRDNAGRILVYCSLGSYWSADSALLKRVIAAFAREPEWELVVGLGSKLTPDDLGPTPPNVLLLRWAPQLQVLARADCCLTHGGNTTFNECATYGVPMVMYSTRHVDQNGCSARMHWHRLGVRANKDSDTPDDIRDNIRHVLTDPDIRHRVREVQERLRQVEYEDPALAAVEAALRGQLGAGGHRAEGER